MEISPSLEVAVEAFELDQPLKKHFHLYCSHWRLLILSSSLYLIPTIPFSHASMGDQEGVKATFVSLTYVKASAEVSSASWRLNQAPSTSYAFPSPESENAKEFWHNQRALLACHQTDSYDQQTLIMSRHGKCQAIQEFMGRLLSPT